MKNISFPIYIFLIIIFPSNCKKSEKPIVENSQVSTEIFCTKTKCEGFYEGPEFINGKDIAHQFSNKMSAKVGEKLKELYQAKNYNKVDFDNIKMTTIGMNSGDVNYKLIIPFLKVANKCDAFTSFDHVGGWNHQPALKERKIQLQKLLIKGDSLDISTLKTTQEGLQEYWIQWRNIELQNDCQ